MRAQTVNIPAKSCTVLSSGAGPATKPKTGDEYMLGLVKAHILPCIKASYTVTEIARAAGKCRPTIYRWIDRGWLKVNDLGQITYESLKTKLGPREDA